jgi:hypothetical protein
MGLRRILPLAASFACLALAACGGGGGGSNPPPVPTPTPSGRTVPVSISIVIPASFGTSAHRKVPKYVSPATSTVRIVVNGGAPQNFSVSGAATCPSPPISGTCTVYNVDAPVGTDTFTITLLDASNNVLSQGTAQATIVLDASNVVNVTFNAVIAGLHVTLGNASPPTGSVAIVPVTLLPLDAAGYTVVGAPGVLPAIAVSDSDSSGATGLYLAGSDGTCNTQAAPPAGSVTTNQSGNQYQPVCLSYSGAALSSATITASISGGPTGSATFTPSQSVGVSGFWLLVAQGSTFAPPLTLERVDAATLQPSLAIAGSNTNLNSAGSLAVDSAGNPYTLTGSYAPGPTMVIQKFSGTTGGNVPPLQTTTFPVPPVGDFAYYLALDGHGSAYFEFEQPSGLFWTIYRVALVNGTSSAVKVPLPQGVQGSGVSALYFRDADQCFYLAVHQPLNIHGTVWYEMIYRLLLNGDGSLTLVSAISDYPNPLTILGFDASGNLIALQPYTPEIRIYASSSFVPGRSTSVTPIATFPLAADLGAVDPSGNIVFRNQPTVVGFGVVPAGSHSPNSAHGTQALFAAAGARTPATGSPGSLSAQPNRAELSAQSNSVPITVTENGYTGPISETNGCGAIANVQPQSGTGPQAAFTISGGTTGGTCTITFGDAGNVHTASVQVGNTTTTINGQAARRRP